MSAIWTQSLGILRDRVPPLDFEAWIDVLEPGPVDGDVLTLHVPSNPMKEWIAERYKGVLEESVSSAASRDMNLRFYVPTAEASEDEDPADGEEAAERPCDEPLTGLQLRLVCEEARIDPRFGFDDFVVGACNQFAHAAGLAVSNRHVKGYNPYFVYGHVGVGKTHLINAIGNYVLSRKPTARIRYVTSEVFTNELIDAIRYDRHEEFRDTYRSLDMLLVDDIQFIAGKERTQEEFFYTFNTLYQHQKQIVVASDRFPKDIPELEDRVRSRFEWGLIADMQAPDLETRVAILRRKCETEGVDIPDDATLFLATHIRSNIRELEGSFNRVCAFAALTGKPVSIDLIRQVLRENLRNANRPISIDEIQKAVARTFNVRLSELKSDRKTRTLTAPRQVAMYLCRRMTASSYPHIGDLFGGRDHSTVIHAVKKVERLLQEDPDFRMQVEAITAELEESRE